MLAARYTRSWGQCLLRGVAPIALAWSFERTILARIKAEKLDPELDQEMRTHAVQKLDDIKESHRADLSRRDALLRKAQAYLVVVTVACTFSFGTLAAHTTLATGPAWVSTTLPWAVVGALSMLAMSAWAALRAFGPTEWFDVYLQHRTEWVPDGDDGSAKEWLIKLIYFNQAYALISTEYLNAAYIGLRNGLFIIFLTLFGLVAAIAFK